MSLPVRWTLAVEHVVEGRDADDNPIETWSAPQTVGVHAVSPGASVELVAAGRDIQSTAWTVYAPAGTVVGARDRVTWQGVSYEVDGEPLDWTHGPWSHDTAGVVVALKKVTG